MVRFLMLACACYVAILSLHADEQAASVTHRFFQPVTTPTLPVIRGSANTPIDRFILVPLEAKQWSMNPEADRASLIRRVSFDLTGLPPTIAELEAFLNDKAPKPMSPSWIDTLSRLDMGSVGASTGSMPPGMPRAMATLMPIATDRLPVP